MFKIRIVAIKIAQNEAQRLNKYIEIIGLTNRRALGYITVYAPCMARYNLNLYHC